MGLHMMDVSQIARATVNTSFATIVPADHDGEHEHGCERKVIIFTLRGAVRFAGSERLTRAVARELGKPDPNDPGSGTHADACAVVFSFKDVFSLNKVAKRIINEDIDRLLKEDRMVVVVDPSAVLYWDPEGKSKHPYIVDDQAQARDYIGGVGCQAVIATEAW